MHLFVPMSGADRECSWHQLPAMDGYPAWNKGGLENQQVKKSQYMNTVSRQKVVKALETENTQFKPVLL